MRSLSLSCNAYMLSHIWSLFNIDYDVQINTPISIIYFGWKPHRARWNINWKQFGDISSKKKKWPILLKVMLLLSIIARYFISIYRFIKHWMLPLRFQNNFCAAIDTYESNRINRIEYINMDNQWYSPNNMQTTQMRLTLTSYLVECMWAVVGN